MIRLKIGKMKPKNTTNMKNKKDNDRDKKIKLLKQILKDKLGSMKRTSLVRPSTPDPEHYENTNLENIIKFIKI